MPGKPPGTVTAADLNEEVFGEFMLMLNTGLTSPSRAVQLAAMAMIPGIEIVHGTHNLLGHPAIEITVTGSQDRESEFLDPSSYAVIGGKVVVRDGQLTTVDLGPIVERHNRLAGQLISMAN